MNKVGRADYPAAMRNIQSPHGMETPFRFVAPA